MALEGHCGRKVDSLFNLTGKVALITGSSKGIGKAIAEELARHGAQVVISSRKQEVCDEVAAAIAHELAHNVLQHRAWLDANGRKRSNVRLIEREADRLMPWLLANAGYDPAAAARFMERWGPVHDGGIFRARTHDGWDERVEFIAAEVDKIRELSSNGTAADWSSRFEREIEF